MKHYDIFKSEGGYRVALGIHNDCPVMDKSPWFETREEAETFRDTKIKDDHDAYIQSLAFSEFDRRSASAEDLKEADAWLETVRGQM